MKQETIDRIRKLSEDRDWDQFHTPVNLAKSLVIEAAELLECFQWSDDEYDLQHVKEELADVMVYCQNMLDKLGLDADDIINMKMDQNEAKYPVEKAKGSSAKYDRLPDKAYFAGGCFWCITPVFENLGAKVICGYAGGDEENPVYEDVKKQKTGHRETICLEYDPKQVTYEKLLAVYLANVDPFDAEGQFIDKGFSYTLAVFYNNEKEKQLAEEAIAGLEKKAGKKPCIAILPYKNFYRAEEYHQDYYLKNPEAFEKELIESGRKKS